MSFLYLLCDAADSFIVITAIDLTEETVDSPALMNTTPGPRRMSRSDGKNPTTLKVADDGPYTRQLEQKTYLVQDDIESASPPPSAPLKEGVILPNGHAKPSQTPGNVQNKIEFFNKMDDAMSAPSSYQRREDLRKHLKPHKPVPTHHGPSGTSKERKISGKKRHREFVLPVKECILKGHTACITHKGLMLSFKGKVLELYEDNGGDVFEVDIERAEYDDSSVRWFTITPLSFSNCVRQVHQSQR